MRRPVRAALRPFAAFLFPDSCLACGAALGAERHVCARCRGTVASGPRSTPLPIRSDPAAPAGTRATFLLGYGTTVRALVHALKYGRRVSVARTLAELAEPALGAIAFEPFDSVVPVPLHAVRLRERGFNQAALLAAELVAGSGVSIVEGLSRVRATADQTHLPRGERIANVRRAFRGVGRLVEGDSILLIDDVVTTGSTLGEAAAELWRVGARKVVCLAVAGRVRADSLAPDGPPDPDPGRPIGAPPESG
jgi:ComF family protein